MFKLINSELNSHCKNHFRELGIMIVFIMYVYKTILYVKINENKLAVKMDHHNYNTRNRQHFVVTKHNKECFKTPQHLLK